jgi:hypothetical protein
MPDRPPCFTIDQLERLSIFLAASEDCNGVPSPFPFGPPTTHGLRERPLWVCAVKGGAFQWV